MAVRAAKNRLHGRTNDRAREILDGLITAAPAGRKFTTDFLTGVINWLDSRRKFTDTRTGRLLQERKDVRLVRPGVWQVVR